MKTHLIALLALTSLAAFAGPLPSELTEATKNPDLSMTIKQPHLLRGNRSLYISTSTPSLSVCKALGFNFFLDGNVTSGEAAVGYAMLTTDGSYSNVNSYNSYRVEEITCYNELSPLSSVEEKIENPDDTVTIYGPKYLRGSKAIALSTSSSGVGICRALGFQKYLEGSVYSGEAKVGNVMVNAEGGFVSYNTYNSYGVKEITCSKSDSTPVLVDANGKKYSRKN